MKRFLCLTLLLTAATALRAEPHYSALFGQSCHLCHAGATGRGMRSLYGSQFFGPTYLPFKPVSFELLEKVKPKLSESVSIGADLRTIWLSENTQDTSHTGLSAPLSTNTGTVTQMEGYMYLALQPTEEVLLYYSQGISSSRFEAYGQANVLPWHGFVKAGQFQENYGWVFADHTSFVRTGLFNYYSATATAAPNAPPYGVGAEIGFHPKYFDVTASFTNASNTFPHARDTQKRWFARASAQHGIESLGLQFSAGGSWFLAPRKAEDPVFHFGEQLRYEGWGGFGGIGWQGLQDRLGCHGGFGFLTTCVLFEYDRKAWMDPIVFRALTAAYSTTQISVMVQPGVWLAGAYDWLDNGWRGATFSGYDHPQAERTTLGLQVFPLPWIEIAPRYRLYTLSGGALRNKQMMELQAHFFF